MVLHQEKTLPFQATPKQSLSIINTSFNNFKPDVLTPATMGSSPASSCAASPATHRSVSSGSSTTSTLRVPVPSPTRPRIDPRYAARLPPPPRNSSESELMPPPAVQRYDQPSIFRPTPIITPDGGEGVDFQQLSAQFPRRFSRSNSTNSVDGGAPWTPTHTPPMKRSKPDLNTSDRFIPNRAKSNFTFNLWEGTTVRRNSSYNSNNVVDGSESGTLDHSTSRSGAGHTDSSAATAAAAAGADANSDGTNQPNGVNTFSANSQQNLLGALLRTELLGYQNENNFVGQQNFSFARQEFQENLYDPTAVVNNFGLTPVKSPASQRLMAAPSKRKRRISKVPFKVLDAPALQDDFYLNLVDWSSQNVLAVGLGACVYLWSACTSKVTKLCDLSGNDDTITSVSWAQRGTHLAVGTNKGEVQLWDTTKVKKVRSMVGHSARVGTLAWAGPILASGSRDRNIYLRDVRMQAPYTDKLSNHKQEVCGLKWSYEEPSFLASGGNDNHLHVIDSRFPGQPLHRFSEHTAAVKAIAWSPHQHGLLASGGGTADRCIRFWNTLSGSSLNKIDTGSQVCNLSWSQNCNEIVSTHGYSLNQIVVWRYPSMSKVATLTGHTYRVLYLATSPDGSTVVTGAGDETLRFWQIFPGPRSSDKDGTGGLLFPNTVGSVIR